MSITLRGARDTVGSAVATLSLIDRHQGTMIGKSCHRLNSIAAPVRADDPMTKWLLSAVLALGSLIWLGTDFVLSQTEQERVAMIMSKLPPQRTTTYKAIRARAGQATIQVLTLTKTEMWSVPRDNVEAVKKASPVFCGRYGTGGHSARMLIIKAEKHVMNNIANATDQA